MANHPYDYTGLLHELDELMESGRGHRLTTSDIYLLYAIWAAIKTLQTRIETLTPRVQSVRNPVAEADDCAYAQFLKGADDAL